MPSAVILSAVRTPYGHLMGSLARLDGPALGARAAEEAPRRVGGGRGPAVAAGGWSETSAAWVEV